MILPNAPPNPFEAMSKQVSNVMGIAINQANVAMNSLMNANAQMFEQFGRNAQRAQADIAGMMQKPFEGIKATQPFALPPLPMLPQPQASGHALYSTNPNDQPSPAQPVQAPNANMGGFVGEDKGQPIREEQHYMPATADQLEGYDAKTGATGFKMADEPERTPGKKVVTNFF